MTLPRAAPRIAIATVVVASAFAGCGKSPQAPATSSAVDRDLRQTISVARHLTGPRHLRMSAYGATMESGKPSELASFLFSSIGVAEWPDSEATGSMEKEQSRATRTPLFAEGVAFVHGEPDARRGKQVVLRGDDAKSELVAEAYLDGSKPPVAVERWAMTDISALKRH